MTRKLEPLPDIEALPEPPAKPGAPAREALRDERLAAAEIRRPLVSVIVTNYNYGPYLAECLASVARQSYPEWECLVVDDVSSDDSRERVEAFLRECPQRERFTTVWRETNGGQMASFRDGLTRCNGAFVVMLDSDDVLLDDFLETHVRVHLGKKPVAFTSSNQYQIDGRGQLISGEHLDHMSKGDYRYVSATTFQKGFWIWATSSSMMYRRSVLELIMCERALEFRICADYYMAHFANLLGSSLLIPSFHGCYRRHGENNFGSNPILGAINSVGNLDKHPPHHSFRRAIMERMLGDYATFYPILGNPGFAIMLYRLALPAEMPGLIRAHPKVFRKPAWRHLYEYAKFRRHKLALERRPWSERLKVIEPPHLRGDLTA